MSPPRVESAPGAAEDAELMAQLRQARRQVDTAARALGRLAVAAARGAPRADAVTAAVAQLLDETSTLGESVDALGDRPRELPAAQVSGAAAGVRQRKAGRS